MLGTTAALPGQASESLNATAEPSTAPSPIHATRLALPRGARASGKRIVTTATNAPSPSSQARVGSE